MSYIAFELDALNVVPDVAAASGLQPGDVAHGLLKLWAWCFREASETVTDTHLSGFFSGRQVGSALEAFGFLEKSGSTWRVKGADRYLRVRKQRTEAGRARSSSAGRSAGRFTSDTPAADQRATSGGPALTPNTEHRAPKEKEASATSAPAPLVLVESPVKAKKERKPPDPEAEWVRFKSACSDDEAAVFRAYADGFRVDLGPDWGLLKLVRQKLNAHPAGELVAAVRGASRDEWHRDKGTSLRSILRDASVIAQFAKKGAA